MKPLNSNNVMKKQISLVFVKFAVCFLLLGLAYRLFLSNFEQFSQIEVNDIALVSNNTLPPQVTVTERPMTVDLPENRTLQNGKCDLFIGNWVRDPSGPVYTNTTCDTIEFHQNCMKNGRPDTEYLYWRWNPRDCDLPRFSPKKFLNLMRNKSFAFIGDSIMRNHVQSLLCLLSQEEQGDAVYHDKQYKSRRWFFPNHNFTLSVIWSPFLAKATVFEDNNGVSTDITQLHLDKPDDVWTQQFDSFDYVFIAGGKWYLKSAIYYENNSIVGCHYCPGKNITQVGFEYAYRKALNSTMKFITSSKNQVYTYFRTATPDHFENGEWNTGGYCNRTGPFKEGEVNIGYVDEVMRKIELEEFDRASEFGLNMKLFDTTLLSLMRPDGHPGVYRGERNRGAKVARYLALHLRFEIDMVAHSLCEYGGGEEERNELEAYREIHFPALVELKRTKKLPSPAALKAEGLCPLMPEETVLMLAALGFNRQTRIYLAGAHIYGGKSRLASLTTLYPNLVTKENLLSSSEIEPFKNFSSQLAALDFIVCTAADVFAMTDSGSQFSSLISGFRVYYGGGKMATIRPNKRRLADIFVKNNTIDWRTFEQRVRKAVRQTKRVFSRPVGRSVYRYPRCKECMCNT